GEDRLHRVVLGLEADAASFAEEPLDGRFFSRVVLAGQRDDDIAVLRVLLAADDDVVAVEDARVDHRLTAYAEDELLTTASERLGDADISLDRMLGEQRAAGGD